MLLPLFRTILLYAVMILVIRILGKRQIGQMEPSEFVVTMMVANLATIPMENPDIPLPAGLIPIGTILGAELFMTQLNLKSSRLRRILCGKPVILVENGNILQQNLRKSRITLDELTGHLREKDVLDIRAVQYAILETNGNLSVFPYPKEMPASAKDAGIQVRKQNLPITVISDGELLKQNLSLLKKDISWVKRVLQQHDADVKGTYLLTVDKQDHIHFIRKEV